MQPLRIRDLGIAGVTHIGITAAVALSVMALIFLVWYSAPFSQAQGVIRLVLIPIGVDMMIGPPITAIVFMSGKRGLRFDLSVIATLQTVALLYGLKAIHGERPAHLVFDVDRFDVVANAEVSRESLSRVRQVALLPSLIGPHWVDARLPDDPKARTGLTFSAVGGGADLPQLPEFFVQLDLDRPAMLKKLRPVEELRKINDLSDSEWRDEIGELGGADAHIGYLPMKANARDGAVILDAKSGEVLKILMLTPRFESHGPKGPRPRGKAVG